MSHCPVSTSTTILSLCHLCLQSNKPLLNSLHSLEICPTYICAQLCSETLSTHIFHSGRPPLPRPGGSGWLGTHRRPLLTASRAASTVARTREPSFLNVRSQPPRSVRYAQEHRNVRMSPPAYTPKGGSEVAS